jgi:hypothetical protein
LESLRSLVRQKTEDRALATTDAASREAQARHAVHAASERCSAAHDRMERLVSAEDARLVAGVTRAGDLARAEPFRLASEARLRELEDAERRARASLELRAREHETARRALLEAKASERAVDAHRASFERSERAREERASEEASEDAHRARGAARARGTR